MKILVVTNRNINNPNTTDETLFGEDINRKGASELRLAWAEKTNRGWRVELIPEPPPRRLTEDNVPSREAFLRFRQQLIDNRKDGVFYIHGYNKPFEESLQQSHEIHARYDVGVVCFSWPANPGGLIPFEYPRARAIARNSDIALDRAFERMQRFVHENANERCNCSFNLLIHSLGNYLFENYVRDPVFGGETRLFDNIVLNAADIDVATHAEWVDLLRFSRRIYATINERDSILDASDVINPDRLGNTARNLDAERAVYLDFTDGDGVGKKHRHFEGSAAENSTVAEFFHRVLHGRDGVAGVSGLRFNEEKNAFELA